jgi:hypothetical protein
MSNTCIHGTPLDLVCAICAPYIVTSFGVSTTSTTYYSGARRWDYCPGCGLKLEALWKHCPGCALTVGTIGNWASHGVATSAPLDWEFGTPWTPAT